MQSDQRPTPRHDLAKLYKRQPGSLQQLNQRTRAEPADSAAQSAPAKQSPEPSARSAAAAADQSAPQSAPTDELWPTSEPAEHRRRRPILAARQPAEPSRNRLAPFA